MNLLKRIVGPLAVLLLGLVLTPESWAQGGNATPPPSISGQVGILWQSYSEDSLIGAVVPPSKTGYNAFANVLYNQGNFSAGIRYESYLNSLLGDSKATVSDIGLRATKTETAALTSPWAVSTTSWAAVWCFAPTSNRR